MSVEKKYVFGPVPSRRLGLSLGIDVVPFKVCSLDCVYCQLGGTTVKSIERKAYVAIEPVLAELAECIDRGVTADYITMSGSGEPTLNSRLGELIDGIKKITDIPVAILTNGTLLYRDDVRADCAKADLVLPSLDAGDEAVFQRLNRPHKDISLEMLVGGISAFRKEFSGQIWLEVFLVDGINTDGGQIGKIKSLIERIGPDRIQLNTAVRPTADVQVERTGAERLEVIGRQLGANCEVIADFSSALGDKHITSNAENVLSVLKRRPCTLEDICSGLNICRNEALKYVEQFERQGLIDSENRGGVIYFFSVIPRQRDRD